MRKHPKLPFLLCFALLLFTSCFGEGKGAEIAQSKISHDRWTNLLQRYVAADGRVDYRGLSGQKEELNTYLSLLSKGIPDKTTWTREEQLAYWINAYNAFTVKLILDNYPVKSIKDLNSTISVPFINSIWDKKFFKLGGTSFSLNMIEHDILRKEFKEPRIHFAINCASVSCPKLRNEAYTASKLEKQLEEQTKGFINDPSKNRISTQNPRISSIFDWFGGDFKQQGSVTGFINKYAATKIAPGATISYMKYNWNLNQ